MSIRRFTGICFWKQHSYLQTTNSVRFISNKIPLIISREQYCGKYLKISVCVIKNDQNWTHRKHNHSRNNTEEAKKKPARQRLVFKILFTDGDKF